VGRTAAISSFCWFHGGVHSWNWLVTSIAPVDSGRARSFTMPPFLDVQYRRQTLTLFSNIAATLPTLGSAVRAVFNARLPLVRASACLPFLRFCLPRTATKSSRRAVTLLVGLFSVVPCRVRATFSMRLSDLFWLLLPPVVCCAGDAQRVCAAAWCVCLNSSAGDGQTCAETHGFVRAWRTGLLPFVGLGSSAGPRVLAPPLAQTTPCCMAFIAPAGVRRTTRLPPLYPLTYLTRGWPVRAGGGHRSAP